MKSWRQRRLIASLPARKLSGKPPRIQSRSSCCAPTSVRSNGASSTNAILPARLSPDWASRSIAAEPSSRNRPVPGALAPALVDHAAQRFEQAGRAVDLIEDHELVRVVGKVQLGLGEARPVRGGLQVQIDRWPPLGDLEGQRGLAGLPRPEQRDGRRLIQQRGDFSSCPSLYHPCNYKLWLRFARKFYGEVEFWTACRKHR